MLFLNHISQGGIFEWHIFMITTYPDLTPHTEIISWLIEIIIIKLRRQYRKYLSSFGVGNILLNKAHKILTI